MAPSSPALTSQSRIYVPGDVIAGKYQLETMLGEGGMGAVWRARNAALDAPVAIKVVRADLNRDAFATRLLQEARAAAKLGHPAIVRVFDVGQTEHGDPFIVMELLEGESFSALLGSRRLAPTECVAMLLPIADALSRAHAKGIVHRDLKPDNVFIVRDEERVQPKLVDFGIVKIEQRDGGSQLTQVGTVVGSPEYMSPEQARGQDDVDHRSDVWSFAVMLYEALTGRLPFVAPNYNALMRMIVEHTPPSVVELAAGDARLSAIVERGMAKDREQRYRSMGEFGRALAHWLLEQGIAEDVCGTSLESKWLGRSSDPAQVRASLASFSDLGPLSGVRGTLRSLPATATEPAHPISSTSLAPQRPDRTWIWIGVAGAAAVAVTLWFGLTRKAKEIDAPPPVTSARPELRALDPVEESVSAEGRVEPKPDARQAAQAELEPLPSQRPAPSASAAPLPKKPSRVAPARSGAPPKKPVPKQAPASKAPADDLLAPY